MTEDRRHDRFKEESKYLYFSTLKIILLATKTVPRNNATPTMPRSSLLRHTVNTINIQIFVEYMSLHIIKIKFKKAV